MPSLRDAVIVCSVIVIMAIGVAFLLGVDVGQELCK